MRGNDRRGDMGAAVFDVNDLERDDVGFVKIGEGDDIAGRQANAGNRQVVR